MNMFMVRRKSGNKELYKDAHDFHSFTKVDLIELSKAPFSNPSGNPKDSQFKSFLEDQVAKGFPSMKTAESFVEVHKRVFDPKNNEPIRAVMWPSTAQVKHIPVPQNCPDGSLHSM